jgi:hypothetical protein
MSVHGQGVLNPRAYDDVKKICTHIQRTIKTLELYMKLQKNHSSELKIATLLDKIQLLVLSLSTFSHGMIDDKLPSTNDPSTPQISDETQKIINDTHKSIDEISEMLLMDISGALNNLCSPDSVVNRATQRLEEVIFHPDSSTGRAIIKNGNETFKVSDMYN